MGRKSKRKSKSNHTIKSSVSKLNVLKNQMMDACKASIDKPILITDRLSLPPYHVDEAEDEESELQLDFQPRPYFASSLCYSCSKFCDEESSFPCVDCGMVVYCSAQHRQQNGKQHKQLCAVLAEICRKNGGLSLAKDLNADEFRSFRVELLQIVERALNRRLELWEREILLYPRLCRLCHAGDDLTGCDNCHMEFFCRGEMHQEHHRGNHAQHCQEFRVFRRILAMQRKNGFAAPRIPDFVLDVEKDKLPENFDALMQEIFAFGDYEKIDCASYAAMSQAASPALTAFYASRNSQFFNQNRKVLKIHVIGAELQFECANVTVWEKFFLHLLPGVKCLKLEFCGPELQVPTDIASVLEHPQLCASCRTRNRKIDIVFHCDKLYHHVENDKPDLVCLFNPGLYRTTGFANQDTWPQTIEKFCDYGVPILVTSYTEVELPLDLARIREFREIQVEQEPRRNPFASLRPERNFVSDDVAPLIYKNYFLSVARGIPGTHTAAPAILGSAIVNSKSSKMSTTTPAMRC